MQSFNYFIIRTAVEMEPNAGDIYGLQQQQRRMSKSNSRAHRMSVATGIRLIHSSEIRDICLFKIFQWKKSKNMLQFLDYENPSIIVRNFKFQRNFVFQRKWFNIEDLPMSRKPGIMTQNFKFPFWKKLLNFLKNFTKEKILFFWKFYYYY